MTFGEHDQARVTSGVKCCARLAVAAFAVWATAGLAAAQSTVDPQPDKPAVLAAAADGAGTAASDTSYAPDFAPVNDAALNPLTIEAPIPKIAVDSDDSDAGVPGAPQAKKNVYVYERPSYRTKFYNYLFDAFGPLPLAGAAVVGGINQAGGHPHEWGGGFAGYGRRFGSNYGIGATTTTTRYALAQLTGEDTLYYRCECSGVFPRFKHAMLSTLTGRRGEDGHRVFSFPSLVAPYAGSFTAIYGWYPDRYGAKDAFRIGNYNLLIYGFGNVLLEFLPSGPRSPLNKFHLQNHHAAPEDAH
jgi:hypothetical protein